MELHYRFTTDAAALNAFRVRTKQPWTMFLCVLLVVHMFLVRIFLVKHDLAPIGWMWLVLSTALGIAVYEVPRFQISRAMKANPCLQGEILLLLNNEGSEFSHAMGKSKLQWRAYTKYNKIQRDTASVRARCIVLWIYRHFQKSDVIAATGGPAEPVKGANSTEGHEPDGFGPPANLKAASYTHNAAAVASPIPVIQSQIIAGWCWTSPK